MRFVEKKLQELEQTKNVNLKEEDIEKVNCHPSTSHVPRMRPNACTSGQI